MSVQVAVDRRSAPASTPERSAPSRLPAPAPMGTTIAGPSGGQPRCGGELDRPRVRAHVLDRDRLRPSRSPLEPVSDRAGPRPAGDRSVSYPDTTRRASSEASPPDTIHAASAPATSRARSTTVCSGSTSGSACDSVPDHLSSRGQPGLALGGLLVQPGVLDRHARRRSQRDDDALVGLGEVAAARLLGQVEVAEHLVADPYRHARGTSSSADGSPGSRRTPGARRCRAAAAARGGR